MSAAQTNERAAARRADDAWQLELDRALRAAHRASERNGLACVAPTCPVCAAAALPLASGDR